jgi:hypothetical protein
MTREDARGGVDAWDGNAEGELDGPDDFHEVLLDCNM